MTSLHEHLELHDAAARVIAFRRDCPLCRAERVQGQLPSANLVSPRACAAVTAMILATSAAVPGTVVADGQGVAVPAPPSPPPPPVADVTADAAAPAPADGRDGGSSSSAAQGADASGPDEAPHATAPAETTAPTAPTSTGDSASGATPPSDTPTTAPHAAPPTAQPMDAGASSDHGEAPRTPAPPAEPPAAAPAAAPPMQQDAGTSPAGGEPQAPSRHETPSLPSETATATRSHAPASARRERSTHTTGHRSTSAGTVPPGDATHDSSRPAPQRNRDAAAAGDQHGSGSRPAADRSRRHARVRTAAAALQAAQTYRVQPGDSLWRIASRHLGAGATNRETAQEVTRLWTLNEQRIGTGDPDLIFPGQTLRM